MAISPLPIEIKGSYLKSLEIYDFIKENGKNHVCFYSNRRLKHIWLELFSHLDIIMKFIDNNKIHFRIPNLLAAFDPNEINIKNHYKDVFDVYDAGLLPVAIMNSLLRECGYSLNLSDNDISSFFRFFCKYCMERTT